MKKTDFSHKDILKTSIAMLFAISLCTGDTKAGEVFTEANRQNESD